MVEYGIRKFGDRGDWGLVYWRIEGLGDWRIRRLGDWVIKGL